MGPVEPAEAAAGDSGYWETGVALDVVDVPERSRSEIVREGAVLGFADRDCRRPASRVTD